MLKVAAILFSIFCAVLTLGPVSAAGSTAQPSPSAGAGFTMCKSTYALCTTAKCTPIAGDAGKLSCGCSVQTGYSVGKEACQPVKHTNAGDAIVSRFYPAKSFAICSNDRPWGQCLDSPCLVDKSNPSRATCTCTVSKNQGPYVIVTNSYSKSTCTTGIISSATTAGAKAIDQFINSEHLIPQTNAKLLNSPAP